MHQTVQSFFTLMIPIALALNGAEAEAKKKKKKEKPPVEEKAQTATPATPPDPTPAAASPAASPTASPAASPAASPTPAATPAATSAAEQPATPPPVASAATSPAPPTEQATPAAPPPRRDGVRFRGGISASGGTEFITGLSTGTLIGALGGIDGRLGVQINKLVGIYIQPHIAFGSWLGLGGPFNGLTGNVAATAMVDFTIIDRIFIGTGVGGGLVNNPGGAVVQFRAGGYPVMKLAADHPRRKGLMLGVDVRVYFINAGGTGTVPDVNIMGGIGYEAF